MSDETTSVDDTGAEGAETVDSTTTEAPAQQAAPDLSRIEQQMQQLAEGNQATAQQLAEMYQHLTAEPEEPEYEPDPDDPEYEDWAAQQALNQIIQEQVQQGIQEALTPFQQAQQKKAWLEGLQAVEQQYPEMQVKETAQPIVQRATQLAEQFGIPTDHPAFADLIEQTYLASKAQELAAGNNPAGQEGARLESGGGAAPATGQDEDIQDRFIKNAIGDGKSAWL